MIDRDLTRIPPEEIRGARGADGRWAVGLRTQPERARRGLV